MDKHYIIWGIVWLLIILVIRYKFNSRKQSLHKRLPGLNAVDVGEVNTRAWLPLSPRAAHLITDSEMSWLDTLLSDMNSLDKDYLHQYLDSSNTTVVIDDLREKVKLNNSDDAGCMDFLLAVIFSGRFRLEDKNKVLQNVHLKVAADKGHGFALFEIAQLEYFKSLSGKINNSEEGARVLYRRSASKNIIPAKFMMAVLYITESSSDGLRMEGLEVLKEAADAGYASANYILGRLYASRNFEFYQKQKAQKYLNRAADAGHMNAQVTLGRLYISGELDDPGLKKAQAVLKKASLSGLGEAQQVLANLYLQRQKFVEALDWSTKAAHQNRPGAFSTIVKIRIADGTVPGYLSESKKWFEYESEHRSNNLLAINFYLACLYVLEKMRSSGSDNTPELEAVLQSLLSALIKLDAVFSEIDFDKIYSEIDAIKTQRSYLDYLLWLLSDYCERTSRQECKAKLKAAASARLEIAITTLDQLNFTENAVDGFSQLGYAAASYKCVLTEMRHKNYQAALAHLNKAAEAGHTIAMLRLAYLNLGWWDYEIEDENFKGLVNRDDAKGIELLKTAASQYSRHAAELLSRLYLTGEHVVRNYANAKSYKKICMQNYDEETSLATHVINALILPEIEGDISI